MSPEELKKIAEEKLKDFVYQSDYSMSELYRLFSGKQDFVDAFSMLKCKDIRMRMKRREVEALFTENVNENDFEIWLSRIVSYKLVKKIKQIYANVDKKYNLEKKERKFIEQMTSQQKYLISDMVRLFEKSKVTGKIQFFHM